MINTFCKACASPIDVRAEICTKCGVRQYVQNSLVTVSSNGRTRLVAVLLAFFLGGFGAHKFYLGRITAGVLYLLFFWTFIPAILSIIDLILLLVMTEDNFNRKYP